MITVEKNDVKIPVLDIGVVSSKECVIVGDDSRDLLLKTFGKIKVKAGNKIHEIDLSKDSKSATNIDIKDTISDVDLSKNGSFVFILEDGSLYLIIDGKLVPVIDNTNGLYLSVSSAQKLFGNRKQIAQKNAGLIAMNISDLTSLSVDDVFENMVVYVCSERAHYVLVDKNNPSNENSWRTAYTSTNGGIFYDGIEIRNRTKDKALHVNNISTLDAPHNGIYCGTEENFIEVSAYDDKVAKIKSESDGIDFVLNEKKAISIKDSLILLGKKIKTNNDVVVDGNLKSELFEPKDHLAWAGGEGYRLNKNQFGEWVLELDHIIARKSVITDRFKIKELVVDRTYAVGGRLILSDGAKISKVVIRTPTEEEVAQFNVLSTDEFYVLSFAEKDQEDAIGRYCPFVKGDILTCQTFNGKDLKKYYCNVSFSTNEYCAIKTSDFSCNILTDPNDASIILQEDYPEQNDDIVQIGNNFREDGQWRYPERQKLIYQSGPEQKITMLTRINEFIPGSNKDIIQDKHLALMIGDMSTIPDPSKPGKYFHGHGLYCDNVMLKGKLVVDNSPGGTGDGKPVGEYMGAWKTDVTYYVGQEVTRNGSLYYCIKDNKNIDPASTNGQEYWDLIIAKGDSGNSINYMELTGDMIFKYPSNSEVSSPDKIELTAELINVVTTTKNVFEYKFYNANTNSLLYTVSTESTKCSRFIYPSGVVDAVDWDVQWGDSTFLTIKCEASIQSSSFTPMSDMFTIHKIKDGSDSYTVLLDNENIVIPAENDGSVIQGSLPKTCTTSLFKGATSLEYSDTIDAGHWKMVVTAANGCSYTKNGSTITLTDVYKLYKSTSIIFDIYINGVYFSTKKINITKALSGADGQSSYVIELTNDSHVVPTDKDGNNGNFFGAETTALIYKGSEDVTSKAEIVKSLDGVTDSSNISNKAVITGMSKDSGFVDFNAQIDGISLTKRFVLSKAKAGINGEDAFVHSVITNNSVIKIDKNNIITNPELVISCYKLTETASVLANSYFSIDYTEDGIAYKNLYFSAKPESVKTIEITNTKAKVFTITAYADVNKNIILDKESLSVVKDGSDGSDGSDGKPGIDGVDAISIDLTNQTSTVNVNSSGAVVGVLQNTQAYVYNGSSLDTGWSFSKQDSNCLSTISESGLVEVSSISADSASVTITASKQGYSNLVAVYTISKVYPGFDGADAINYWITPSANKIQKTKSGRMIPAIILCEKWKQIGSSAPNITIDNYLYYKDASDNILRKYSNGINIPPTSEGITLLLSTNSTTANVNADNTIDVENVPVIADGTDGTDGKDGLNGANGVNGNDGTSIIFKGAYEAHPSNPQNGWCYYNILDKKSYVYQSGSWYQMTIDGVDGVNGTDGVDGLSIEYKGEMANPPANPQKNWSYRDIDNGMVYIFNGLAWVLMVSDGTDGSDGLNGVDGLSVFITYNDNAINDKPSKPTGNGTADGWHTAPGSNCVWMSQKVAASSTAGAWGEPIQIKGADGTNGKDGINGADGVDGSNGVSIVFKGSYSTHPENPQNGWCYYNTVDKKSYVYQSNSWYQMTVDGVNGINGTNGTDGLSIEYKGEMINPPANPEKNWSYRDADNGMVYIYNGLAWVLMVSDGTDGSDGLNGKDGLSVFITYNDNLADNKPSKPTGNGTTNGWHTAPTGACVWMSQKVALSPTEGIWGEPIKIKGVDGTDGKPGIDGQPGIDGENARVYYISTSVTSVIKKISGDLIPSSITTSSYVRIGNKNAEKYTGVIIIEKAVNGANWAIVSENNKNTVTFAVDGAVSLYRISFYDATKTVLYDERTIPVVSDGPQGELGPIYDWVKDWNENQTIIDGKGVITPRIYAGEKDANNKLTGVYIGKGLDMSSTGGYNGIIGLSSGDISFLLDAKTGKVTATSGDIAGWELSDNGFKKEVSYTEDAKLFSNIFNIIPRPGNSGDFISIKSAQDNVYEDLFAVKGNGKIIGKSIDVQEFNSDNISAHNFIVKKNLSLTTGSSITVENGTFANQKIKDFSHIIESVGDVKINKTQKTLQVFFFGKSLREYIKEHRIVLDKAIVGGSELSIDGSYAFYINNNPGGDYLYDRSDSGSHLKAYYSDGTSETLLNNVLFSTPSSDRNEGVFKRVKLVVPAGKNLTEIGVVVKNKAKDGAQKDKETTIETFVNIYSNSIVPEWEIGSNGFFFKRGSDSYVYCNIDEEYIFRLKGKSILESETGGASIIIDGDSVAITGNPNPVIPGSIATTGWVTAQLTWSSIRDKPTTFTPSAHIHKIADVTDLSSTLSNKLNASIFVAHEKLSQAHNSTSLNTPSTMVFRNSSGNFSANIITANLDGNASSATKLQTKRTLWGQSFDGTANISGGLSDVSFIKSNGVDGYFFGNAASGISDKHKGGLIYAYGDNPLYFYTNARQRMIISGGGDVEISNNLFVKGEATTYSLDGVEAGMSTQGAMYLRELADVSITNEVANQYLKYNGTKWVNSGISYSILTDKPNIPNVPAWALATTKPSYSWSEIDSKPSTFTPSAHTHTKANITDFPTSMPASDVHAWAKAASKPTYTASEVGALASGGKAADSDKLDGVDSVGFTRYLPSATNTDTVIPHNSNLNLFSTGFKPAGTTLPVGVNYITGLRLKHSTGASENYENQLVFGTSNTAWMRSYNNGTWSDYCKIWHEGNSNLSSVNWSANRISANDGYLLKQSDIIVAQTAYSNNNGGYSQWNDPSGTYKSIVRGYSVDGLQAEFHSGGISVAGVALIHGASKDNIHSLIVKGGSKSTYYRFAHQTSHANVGYIGCGDSSNSNVYLRVENDLIIAGGGRANDIVIYKDKSKLMSVNVGISFTDRVLIGSGTAGTTAAPDYKDLNFRGAYGTYAQIRMPEISQNSGEGSLEFWVRGKEGVSTTATPSRAVRIGYNGLTRFYKNIEIQKADYETVITSSNPGNAFSFIDSNHNSSNSLLCGIRTAGDGMLWHRGNKSIVFGTNGEERIKILPNGDIGIGNSNPSSKLHVAGTTRVDSGYFFRSEMTGSGWNNGDGVITVDIANNSSQTPLFLARRAAGTRMFAMEFLNSGAEMRHTYGGNVRFIFTRSGFLGINKTITPTNALEVGGSGVIDGNLIVKGEVVSYTQDGVQTTNTEAARGAYVTLAQYQELEQRLVELENIINNTNK